MVLGLLTLVFKTHHIVKNCHFDATSFCNRRLFEIAFCSDVANDAFAIEAFLKSAKSPFNRLALLYINFNWHEGEG